MKTIGIDDNNFLVYEGSGNWGHGVWPTPTIIPATILDISDGDIVPEYRGDLLPLNFIFIDDGFDPSSRIRIGRIYEKRGGQPQQWNVHPHPAIPQHGKLNTNNMLEKSLLTYSQFNFFPKIQHLKINEPGVVLGHVDHFTVWSVVDAESLVSGETLLYLKSRKVIGALPKLDYSKITKPDDRQAIENKMNLLSNDLRSAGPDSIVDRCREAASSLINCYLLQNGLIAKSKDLGQLVADLKDSAKKNIAADCASILAKLHSRTKHIEQVSRGTRMVSENDAQMAVQAVGMIIVELDWGSWTV